METPPPPPAAKLFDALGITYEQAFAHSPAHLSALEWLIERLPPAARVLDVGSGTGRPTAATLTEAGHSVLGIDVSPVMTALATRQVPEADFRCADIRKLPLEPDSFDAICIFFSLLQMTRTEQKTVTHRLTQALKPGGHLLLATVPADVEDIEVTLMGHPVRATSFSDEALVPLLEATGLTVLAHHTTTFTPTHPAAVPEPHTFLYTYRPQP
ncbi:class I SAM-dependent methyltransferase [Streptomyces boninensis]|uniref:class I SAM-dependent methyltransferase n=1 Tax=Streptomyces boninensis TaxID=2039455 RepID=UPI003B213FF6